MRGRPLDLCVALVAIAWLSVTFGLGLDSAPGRGSNADRATRTPSEQKDAAPGAREGAGEPLDPGADPFPRVTPLAPETQGLDAPPTVPTEAPAHEAPKEAESQRGACVIAVRAPKTLPFDVLLAIVDERPYAFEQIDDPRVVDALDYEEIVYDPLDDAEEREPLEAVFEDLPLDRPLWLVVHGANAEQGSGEALCIRSLVRELGPIASADERARFEVELQPRAALSGSWTALVASAPSDEGEEAELEELDLAVKAEIRHHLDARQNDHGSRFTLFPAPAGELEVALEAGLHADRWRTTLRVRARANALTELATWYVLAEHLATTLVARSDDGQPLEGDFELELEPGWSASEVPADSEGMARLHGDWRPLRRVRFTPDDERVSSAELDVAGRHAARLELVCTRRTGTSFRLQLIARLPDGEHVSTDTLAWARRIGETEWRNVDLGYSSGCGGRLSSLFEPGSYEICAWMASKAASFDGRVELPEDLEGQRYLRLRFDRPNTRVVCEVSASLAGHPAQEFLRPQLHLLGESAREVRRGRDQSWTQDISPFAIELRGLPPGRSFTISFDTVKGRALRRLECVPRAGESCDLGPVVLPLD